MATPKRIGIKQWLGRVSNADPNDLPPGANQLQENIRALIPGQLDVRGGLLPITARGTYDIIAIYYFHRPEAEWIVWENTNGDIKAARLSDLSTIVTLGTGYNTFQPMCFAKTRRNVLIGVNGIDRGFRWDGLTTSLEPLGIDAPATAHTLTATGTGGASAGDYEAAIRWLDDDIGFANDGAGENGEIPSSLSPSATATATAGQKFTHTAFPASSQSRVAAIEIYRTLADETETYYRLNFTGVGGATVSKIGYGGTITSSANNGGNVRFTLPAGHGLVVGAQITVTGHSVVGYNTTHNITAVAATTVDSDVAYTSDGTGGTWRTTGYTADTADDDTLATQQSLAIFQQDGTTPNARRFVPPPDDRPLVCVFQDRVFYAGTVHYTKGTVTTNGTTTLTGSGTDWTSTMVGRFVYIEGEPLPFKVAGFTSATSITLSAAATTSDSGLSYAIDPPPSKRNELQYSEVDEEESVLPTNTIAIQDNTGDSDEITAISGHGASMLVGKERHLYSMTFFRQPNIDAKATPIDRRGVINNRCQATFESGVYLWDQMGFYRVYANGAIDPIGMPVQDLVRQFSSEKIDWTNQKWFFAACDPVLEIIKFYFQLSGDTGTKPKRWLEFHVRTESWWLCSSVEEQGGACVAPYTANRLRLIAGGQAETLLLCDEGTTDGISAQIRGTATAGGANTLTDSGASFTSAVVGAPVAIVSGTGKGQIRRISQQTSTQLTVSENWTTQPAADSVYLVGAISWLLRTGRFDLGVVDKEDKTFTERAFRLRYRPTSGDCSLDLRRYFDDATSPRNHLQATQLGIGWQTTAGDPDAVLDMKLTRSVHANTVGFAKYVFGGITNDNSRGGDRGVAIELRGFQGDDRITLFDAAMDGVA